MVTRGQTIVDSPIEGVFEMVLKCCNEKKIKNLEVDIANFQLKGETPFSMISQRSKAKIIIKLKSLETEQSKNSTKIEIYDYNDHLVETVPDDSFIQPFQKCLENLIPIKSKFELDLVELKDKYSTNQTKSRKSRQKAFAVFAISLIALFVVLLVTVGPKK